jgi:membrane protease YdiL (CAAX protease family)
MITWAVSVIFVYAATFVLNVVIEQMGIPNTMEDTFIAMANNVFGLLSIALLAPVLEELLFRGAIEGELLRQGYKPWIAILLSSLIFGVVHLNPAQIPFAFLIGMMFGWLYYRTGSLLPGIVGHILNNSVAAYNMIQYGNATIEEQLSSTNAMWQWTILAIVVFVVATVWLNRDMVDKETDSICNREEK